MGLAILERSGKIRVLLIARLVSSSIADYIKYDAKSNIEQVPNTDGRSLTKHVPELNRKNNEYLAQGQRCCRLFPSLFHTSPNPRTPAGTTATAFIKAKPLHLHIFTILLRVNLILIIIIIKIITKA